MSELGNADLASFEESARREWWLGNGMGGWASGTVAGAHGRKYHGLLIAALGKPEAPVRLLSKLEETALAGEKRVALSCNYYPGVVHPGGHKLISRFFFDGAIARWTYEFGGRRLAKEVWCAHGAEATHIRYTLLEGEATGLEVVPLVGERPAHGLGLEERMRGRGWFSARERSVEFRGPPAWRLEAGSGMFRPHPDVYRNFQYPLERGRGEAFEEDLAAPGRFEVMLREGHHFALTAVASAGRERGDWQDASGAPMRSPAEPTERQGRGSLAAEEPEAAGRRLDMVVEQFRQHNRFSPKPELEGLVRASDVFVIRDRRQYNIVAGYPYFGRWARDAMIALPGLCIYTGRHALAREIMEHWMGHLRGGLLPNRFDGNGQPAYESADGFLWMMWAISELEDEGGLPDGVRARWWPALRKAMREWVAGNEMARLDGDGLVSLADARSTWMDAAVDGQPITPRAGKRVEINALWVHALARAARMAGAVGDKASGEVFSEAHALARSSISKFYNEYAHYLDDGIEPTDGSLRPNQLWALALPDIGLSVVQQRQALHNVKEHLLVEGQGLRSLASTENGYMGQYGGARRERDLAYHQGAIWPWLLGAYASAQQSIYPQRVEEIERVLHPLLTPGRPGALLGIGELFDPAGGQPAGAPLQAWSVGEVLRASVMLERARMRGGGMRTLAGRMGNPMIK